MRRQCGTLTPNAGSVASLLSVHCSSDTNVMTSLFRCELIDTQGWRACNLPGSAASLFILPVATTTAESQMILTDLVDNHLQRSHYGDKGRCSPSHHAFTLCASNHNTPTPHDVDTFMCPAGIHLIGNGLSALASLHPCSPPPSFAKSNCIRDWVFHEPSEATHLEACAKQCMHAWHRHHHPSSH